MRRIGLMGIMGWMALALLIRFVGMAPPEASGQWVNPNTNSGPAYYTVMVDSNGVIVAPSNIVLAGEAIQVPLGGTTITNLAKIAPLTAPGTYKVPYTDGSGSWGLLALGASGTVFKSMGAASAPQFGIDGGAGGGGLSTNPPPFASMAKTSNQVAAAAIDYSATILTDVLWEQTNYLRQITYAPATGKFTVQVPGIYLISAHLGIYPIAARRTCQAQIWHDSGGVTNYYIIQYSPNDAVQSAWQMGTDVTLNCASNDFIWVRAFQNDTDAATEYITAGVPTWFTMIWLGAGL